MNSRDLKTYFLPCGLFMAATVLFVCMAAAPTASAQATNYPATILSNNPSAYYRFEETTNGGSFPGQAVDSSGNGFNATIYENGEDTSPLLGLPGITTNSYSFQLYNGSTSDYGYVDVPNAVGLTGTVGTNPAPFSTELWVQPQAGPGNAGWAVPFEVAAYPNGWNFYVSGPGDGNPGTTSYFYLDMRPGVFQGFGNFPITFFQWYYLALTFDGTNAITYINGSPQATNNATGFAPAAGADGHIGSGQGAGWSPFVGGIDEFAFYTNVLTASQVLNHYKIGTNSFRAVPTPGSVAVQPVSITNYSGTTATFSVVGQGTAPLSYQWRTNGTAIPGATSTSYSLLAQYPQNNGEGFTVVVSNGYGSQTSSVATLTVLSNLTFIASPGSITRNVGSHAAFHATVIGAIPITYQWAVSTNGGTTYTNISGTSNPTATNQTLWLSNVQLSQNGNVYSVVVSNPFVSSTQMATLNVQTRQDPPVPLHGYGAIIAADNPVAYWRLDETNGPVAVDAIGSFDGTYTPNSGTITLGAASGIPHSSDPAVTLSGTPGGSTEGTIQVPWAPELNPDTAWSVETWIQPSSLGTGGGDYRVVLSSEYNRYPYAYNGWYLYQQPSGTLAFVPQPGNGFIVAPTAMVPGNWYYVAIVDDTTNFYLYVNGQLGSSFPISGDQFIPNGDGINTDGNAAITTIDAADDSASFVIGQRTDAAFDNFLGTVDDTAVYQYALSPKQIASHYADAGLLNIAKAGTNTTLTWPVGVLQSSTNVAGAYTTITNATSPYTNGISGTTKFYRLVVP